MTTRPKQYTCTECGEACEGIVVDFGIGTYEYWGQRCNDVQKAWVSDCCEAAMIDPESGGEVDAPDDPRNEYDPERDGYLSTEDERGRPK